MDDRQLLNQYLADRDQQAFAELVRRHIDLVYSAARRQVADDSAAQDVTQQVFLTLATKGGTIRGHELLGSWLFTVTRFAAIDWRRADVRRRLHETRAAAMKDEAQPPSEPVWESIQPMLDDAVSRLGTFDVTDGAEEPAVVASAVEFLLEGLHLARRLNKERVVSGTIYHR